MKRETSGLWIGLLAFIAMMPGYVHADLVRNPAAIGASIDAGQIVQGTIYDGSQTSAPFKGNKQPITRTGVYLTESGTYNDRLTVQLTIGGLFWFSLPEDASFQTRRIQFGPGVGEAQGRYAFGSDPKNPAATLQFGLFGYKYSESVNLGEYLYRSGTYPGILTSGGWSYINAAAYMAQGLRLTVPMWGGKIIHDVTLFMERDLEPTNDFSPGYILTIKPVTFLEFGGGAVWAHGISMNGKRLTPKSADYAYSKTTGKPIKDAYDTATINTLPSQYGYYTFKGFKTMGRAAFNIGAMLGMDAEHSGSFKLYSEIALLGVKNQPFYYEKKTERMPMMVGLNIPTFGILDRLAFEVENHKSPFPNTNASVLQSQLPIPINAGESPYIYDLKSPRYTDSLNVDYVPGGLAAMQKKMKNDDLKWTLYARRTVSKGVAIYAQAANDHLRHFNFTATPAAIPATSRPSDWYYVIRLEFGI